LLKIHLHIFWQSFRSTVFVLLLKMASPQTGSRWYRCFPWHCE